MKLKKKIRIVAIISLLLITFHFCFALKNINHECTHDDDCPICSLISTFQKNINNYSPSLTKAISIILISILIVEYLIPKLIEKKKYTLVGLKVELIN